MDRFARPLLDRAERNERPAGFDAGRLAELALSGVEGFFAGLHQALRDRPRMIVVLSPERPSGMREKDAQLAARSLEQEQTRARVAPTCLWLGHRSAATH